MKTWLYVISGKIDHGGLQGFMKRMRREGGGLHVAWNSSHWVCVYVSAVQRGRFVTKIYNRLRHLTPKSALLPND